MAALTKAQQRAQYRRDHPWETWAFKCIHSARAAGKVVSLTQADIGAILKKQDYRCALTGLPFWTDTKKAGSASWDSPSLDRIAHGGSYSAANVRIILHCVNSFRGRMPDLRMIMVARALIAMTGKRGIRIVAEAGAVIVKPKKGSARLCRFGERSRWYIYHARRRISTGCTDRTGAEAVLADYVFAQRHPSARAAAT